MAWGLLAELLDGTLDDAFPIKESKSRELQILREGSEDDCDSEYRQTRV